MRKTREINLFNAIPSLLHTAARRIQSENNCHQTEGPKRTLAASENC